MMLLNRLVQNVQNILTTNQIDSIIKVASDCAGVFKLMTGVMYD